MDSGRADVGDERDPTGSAPLLGSAGQEQALELTQVSGDSCTDMSVQVVVQGERDSQDHANNNDEKEAAGRHFKSMVGLNKAGEGIGNAADAVFSGTAGVVKRTENSIDNHCPSCVTCLFCCCCWTGSGLRNLLTSGSTLEYAVGFVIGEQFGSLIYGLTAEFVTPLLSVIFAFNSVDFVSKSGFLVLTNPYDADIENNVTSASQAKDLGCAVIDFEELAKLLFAFLLTISTLYWFIAILQKYQTQTERLEAAQLEDSQQDCPMCFSKIDIRATRCRYCTSYVRGTEEILPKFNKQDSRDNSELRQRSLKRGNSNFTRDAQAPRPINSIGSESEYYDPDN